MSKGSAAESADPAAVTAQLEREIATAKLDLPVLPQVASEVLSSSLDDQSDAARLAEHIQQDPSLASHVLRVVNSPAFRGATEILALQQAIARLGMERIREIALSAALRASLYTRGSFEAVAEERWRVALASGLWAKEVARASGRSVELAYLCGLLHDIGAPLVLRRLDELAPGLGRPAVTPMLDRLAPLAGASLARAWRLPEPVQVCITTLADFEAAGAERDIVAVTACGVALARWMCLKSLLISELTKLPATRHLALAPEDVEQMLECRDQIRVSMESMGG